LKSGEKSAQPFDRRAENDGEQVSRRKVMGVELPKTGWGTTGVGMGAVNSLISSYDARSQTGYLSPTDQISIQLLMSCHGLQAVSADVSASWPKYVKHVRDAMNPVFSNAFDAMSGLTGSRNFALTIQRERIDPGSISLYASRGIIEEKAARSFIKSFKLYMSRIMRAESESLAKLVDALEIYFKPEGDAHSKLYQESASKVLMLARRLRVLDDFPNDLSEIQRPLRNAIMAEWLSSRDPAQQSAISLTAVEQLVNKGLVAEGLPEVIASLEVTSTGQRDLDRINRDAFVHRDGTLDAAAAEKLDPFTYNLAVALAALDQYVDDPRAHPGHAESVSHLFDKLGVGLREKDVSSNMPDRNEDLPAYYAYRANVLGKVQQGIDGLILIQWFYKDQPQAFGFSPSDVNLLAAHALVSPQTRDAVQLYYDRTFATHPDL
jgi:hypothetical protein